MSPPPAELTPDNLGVKIAAGEPWRAPRCVLAVAQHLLVATSPGLWLDSLHVQFARWPEPVAEVDDDDYSPPIDYTYAYGLPEYPCAPFLLGLQFVVHCGRHHELRGASSSGQYLSVAVLRVIRLACMWHSCRRPHTCDCGRVIDISLHYIGKLDCITYTTSLPFVTKSHRSRPMVCCIRSPA